jgi:transposase
MSEGGIIDSLECKEGPCGKIEEVLDELRRLRAENTDLKRQNLLQGEEIRLMKLRKYGQSSEKLSAEDISQGTLFDEAELYSTANDDSTATEEVRITKTVYTRRKRGRKPLSPKLSRIEVVVDLSDEEKTAAEGFELIQIGEEVSEQVHEVPQKYIVIRTIRPKYVVRRVGVRTVDDESTTEETPTTVIKVAPLPPRILPRSIATPSLLAAVLIGKFCDALPFYRQERMFARHGLVISRQDMANWAIAIAKKLESLIELMKGELLTSPYLHCDETFFQVMDEPGRVNTTQSFMWVTTGGTGKARVALYQYSRTRNAGFIKDFLASYKGYLQTDGYDGYTAIGEKDGIVHVGCWAHARRKFVEALKITEGKGSAPQIIALIGQLYEVERTLRVKYFASGRSGDLDAFASERKDAVLPVFQKIDAWLTAKEIEVTPQSALGKAVSYIQDLWPRLVRYLECPYLTPDNNEAERAIRPFTIGRKNWMISGGPRGAFASATLYSFIETAKLCALEPYYYLRYVLSKLPLTEPATIGSLLPWNIDPNAFGQLTAEDARISLDSIPIA